MGMEAMAGMVADESTWKKVIRITIGMEMAQPSSSPE